MTMQRAARGGTAATAGACVPTVPPCGVTQRNNVRAISRAS